jgi:hypothetical protein
MASNLVPGVTDSIVRLKLLEALAGWSLSLKMVSLLLKQVSLQLSLNTQPLTLVVILFPIKVNNLWQT